MVELWTLTSLQFSMCFFSPSTVFLLTLLHFGHVTLPLATIWSCQRSSWLPVDINNTIQLSQLVFPLRSKPKRLTGVLTWRVGRKLLLGGDQRFLLLAGLR